MNRYFLSLLLGVVLAWALVPAPAHAAWTATEVVGISTTPVGARPVGIFVYPPVRGAAVLNKEANTQWLINLDTGDLAATKQWNIGIQPNAIALNPAGTELWVADDDGKRLLRFSVATRSLLETIPLAFEPTAIAFNADGSRLFIASEDRLRILNTSNRTLVATVALEDIKAIGFWGAGNRAIAIDGRKLYVINPLTATVETTVPAGSGLVGLALDPASGLAYVADRHTNSVAAIDLNTRTYRGRYALPDEPAGIAFDPLNARVLVTLRKLGQLARLDPTTAVLLPSIFLGEKLTAVATDNKADQAVVLADKEKAFIVNLLDHTSTEVALPAKPKALGIDDTRHLALIGLNKQLGLRFLDLTTQTLLPDVVTFDTQARAIAVDPTRALAVVVVKRKDKLLLVDVQNRLLLATLNIPGEFRDVAIHTGKGLAYVVNQAKSTGEVVILDLATRTVTGTIAVSKDAESIVIDEELNRAVVAIEEKNKLEVIDLNTNLIIATHALTKHPRSLALNPTTHTVVVTAKDSDQIALLDLATQTLTANFAALDKPLETAVSTRFNQALVTSAERGEIVFLPLPNPVPVLTQLQPPQIFPSSALVLTAVGDKFIDGASRIVLNGQFLTTRWKDTQHLEVDVPAGVLSTPGNYPVKIVTAVGGSGGGLSGGGGESQTLTFTVLYPAPILTGIAPSTLQANGRDQVITLTGDKFFPASPGAAGSQVFFGARLLASTYVSATQLKATVPGSLLNQSGSVPVTVFNPAPGGGTSAPINVQVVGATPTIAGFTPTHGPLGTQVTITGTNFDALNPGSNDVRFNGSSKAVVVSASATQLVVIVPTTATTGTISVTTTGGTATSTGLFTVDATQDFNLTLTPQSIQVPVRGFGSTRVKLQSTGLANYTQLASLSVLGLPAGMTFKLDRPNVYLNQDVLVTFQTDGSTPPGSYVITLRGTGVSDIRPVTRDQTLTLQVLETSATTVTGRVLNAKDDSPMVGARVRLGTQATTTDATGTYRFLNPTVVGDQVVLVDGGVLNTTEVEYPSAIPSPVMVVANQDNTALTTYLQGIDPRKFTPIAPGAETHVTVPEIPNYELRIPQGAVLYGWDGTPIDKVNVRTVSVDRLPIKPLPEGINAKTVYLYYFFREGGANPTRPIPVTMNNDLGALPGEKIDLWYYDESPTPDPSSNQWRMMGQGTVSQDGKSIVSDPGVGIPKFCCGATTASNSPGPEEDNPPGGEGNPEEGSPDDDGSSGPPRPPNNHYGDPWDSGGPYGPYPNVPDSAPAPSPQPDPAPSNGDASGNGPTSGAPNVFADECGNPVDTSNGAASVFEARHFGITSLSGVDLTCRYRSTSTRIGFFGRGTRFAYDWFAEQVGGQAVRVTTPSGVRYMLSLQGDGVYRATSGRAGGMGMEVTPTAAGRTLRLKGGSEYDFDTRGRLLARRSKAGNTVRFTLDANGFITAITDATGHVYTIETTRVQIGRVIYTLATKMTDPLGRSQRFTYDSLARIASVTDAGGNLTSYTYDANGRITAKTDARGAVTQYEYDANGRATREILADGAIYRFAYVTQGNLVTETRMTDPNGNVTTYRFNGQGYQARRIDALGRVFKNETDYATNFLMAQIDPLGRTTRYTYDGRGNRTSTVDPAGNTTIVEYDPKWNTVTRSINALGNVTTFTYNDQGKLATVTNPEGETISYTYTPQGQFATVTDPLGRVTRFTYDDQGNLITKTDPLGRLTQKRYDQANRLSEMIDPRGRSTRYTYDNLNRLTQTLDAFGNATAYTYDEKDNVLTVTDPKGAVIETNAYDLRRQLTRRTDALGRATTYQYDGVGSLTRITDRKGQVTTTTYDALNRISRTTYADGQTADYAYDLSGNLTRVSDSVSGEALYTYDSLDRLTSETTDRGTVSYQYDAIGRITERRINGQDPTVYTYDRANRVRTITYRNRTVTYTYDGAGRLTSRTLPNGITQQFAWSDANEVLSITYRRTDGTVTESVSYTYDANSNRVVRNRAGLGSLPDTAFTATYDAANRMLTFNGQPLTYDDNGNLVQRQTPQGTITHSWDAQNRLIAISGPNGTASFKYDHYGRRIEKTVNGQTTSYLYHGHQAIAELQGTSIGATYLTGLQIDEVLANFTNQGSRTLLTDALGSVIAATDDNQTTQTIYGYSSFGEQTQVGESGNALQYTGRENDNTGLYYYRARYYDPQMKRFISEDPIGLAGGINNRTYVGNNPLGSVDPFGLEEVCVASAKEPTGEINPKVPSCPVPLPDQTLEPRPGTSSCEQRCVAAFIEKERGCYTKCGGPISAATSACLTLWRAKLDDCKWNCI